MGLQLVKPNTFINNTYIEAKGNNRLVTWDIAKVSFISHPFLGSGFNNFSYDYQKYFSHEILKEENPEFYFNQPHNVIWEYASNNGVLGLLSFFSLLIFTFLALFIGKEDDYKKERSIKIALIGALFGYFVQNFFGFDTPVTYLMLFFLIGIAMGLSNKEWVINVSEKYKNLLKIKAGILIAICLIGVVIFIILPIKEFREWGNLVSSKNSKERISIRENVQKISLFGGIVDSVNGADKFYDFFTKNLSSDVRENKKLYEDEIQSILKQLEEGIKKQPNEIQAYIKYSQFLSLEIFMKGEMNDVLWNKSYDSIKKALTINPRNPEIYLLLAQTYILKEDFKNVYFAIHKALEIGPKYKKSYDYANKILKIKPDADFQKFINEMMIKNDIKL
jgi:tetratricopeptide (TPR) repeat protein